MHPVYLTGLSWNKMREVGPLSEVRGSCDYLYSVINPTRQRGARAIYYLTAGRVIQRCLVTCLRLHSKLF